MNFEMNFEQFVVCNCNESCVPELVTPNAESEFIHVEVCEPPAATSVVDTETSILAGGA